MSNPSVPSLKHVQALAFVLTVAGCTAICTVFFGLIVITFNPIAAIALFIGALVTLIEVGIVWCDTYKSL